MNKSAGALKKQRAAHKQATDRWRNRSLTRGAVPAY